jgi:Rrf2 family transcriptional regulator, cysteine metabolism repressor
MKLSTRTHYLVQVLLDLELHYKGDSPVPLRDIAQRQNMSQAYLEQMMTHLVAGGLVRSVRGPKGGIVLTKSAKEINLKEIVELLEGPTDLVECLVNAKICPRSKLCAVRDIWYEMKIAMDHVLASTTLHDLAERQRDKGTTENIYSI